MADTSDVENALVALATGVVYPNGAAQPSIINAPVRLYRGWPNSQTLDTDLKAGTSHVSVFTDGTTRRTTRYPKQSQTDTVTAPTLTVSGPTASGGSAWQFTFGGTGGSGQTAGIKIAGLAYVYQLGASDTPTTVTAAFAGVIAGASSAGAVLRLPAAGTDTPVARIVGSSTIWTELRRQEQDYQLDFWCPSPATRDSLAAPVDQAFANTDWLTAADNSACRMVLRSMAVSDLNEKDWLWRRTQRYCVEYPTTLVQPAPIVLFGDLTLTPSIMGGPAGTTGTIYV